MGSNEKSFAIITICGIVGIIFAIMLQMLYDNGILIDVFVNEDFPLREIQLLVVLIWEVFGIGLIVIDR